MVSRLSCILFVLMFALLKCGRSLRLGAHFGRCKPTPQNVLFATKKIATNRDTWESAGEGKTLVIVESPAKARTIQKFVDDSYIIDYSAGHIRDLPTKATQNPTHVPTVVSKMISLTTASLGIDVHDNFKPLYVNSPEKADLIKRLKGQAKVASRILLATDEDREGEAISWHLLETIKPTVPYKVCSSHYTSTETIPLHLDSVQSILFCFHSVRCFTRSPKMPFLRHSRILENYTWIWCRARKPGESSTASQASLFLLCSGGECNLYTLVVTSAPLVD